MKIGSSGFIFAFEEDAGTVGGVSAKVVEGRAATCRSDSILGVQGNALKN